MKKLIFVLAFFCVLTLNAQNYQITFSGTGASTSVASVIVENLKSGITATLAGTDILSLTVATGIETGSKNETSGLKIYPNPMTDYSTLDILPTVKGDAVITISEMTGKPVAREKVYLENVRQGFRLAGLKSGLYLVDVKGNGFRFSGKLISNGKADGVIRIEKDNSVIQSVNENEVKTVRKAEATVIMAYTTGDILKFTGASGNYRTIITDIPTGSKVINFNFISCIDGDLNIYPVVTIGTQPAQIWMAANLKTTKYNDGITVISNVTDNTTWSTQTTAAYCDYSNVPTYSNTYGRLYNWYVVAPTNPKNVCPTGWHVPTDAEWTALASYLGGAIGAAGKLKETGIINWATPNVATNETGFTALPGGDRAQDGSYGLIGRYGSYWTSTQGGTSFAFFRYMMNSNGNLGSGDDDKRAAYSVRCIK